MTTFTVDDVKPVGEYDWYTKKSAPYEPFTTVSTLKMFKANLGQYTQWKNEHGETDFGYLTPAIEASSECELVGPDTGLHPLIECLNHAYDRHLPVVLTPDVIWTCIEQGVATHIKANVEALRHKFVAHQGQEFIEITRNEFVKGSPDNDWAGCFSEFSQRLKGHIGDKHELFVADFDTTNDLSRAVSEIILMDAMSAYFSYGVRTCCGFPRFTLEGSPNDWEEIQGRVRRIREIDPGLAFWLDHLDPTLEELVKASKGNPNKSLWSNFYKSINHGSGGPNVSGWINTLFPYVGKGKVNPALNWAEAGRWSCPHPSDFTGALSTVDVKWAYYTQSFDMKFVAGLIGVTENVEDDNALQPQFGWCVYDATAKKVRTSMRGEEL